MRSKVSTTKPASSLAPDQYTAATNGVSADLLGFDANVISIETGAFGGTTPTAAAKIQSGTDGTTFTDVADSDLDGVTGNAAGFALAASSVKRVGYIGDDRYVRVILSAVTGTTPVIRAAATVVRLAPKLAP